MMQKIADLERANSFSSSTIMNSSAATVMMASSPIPTPSPLLSTTTDSSGLDSPLSPEEMNGMGGTKPGSSFPFSLPSIMSLSQESKTPSQLMLCLGIQILEGRIPDHKQGKGFLEGMHCSSLFKSVSHFCDFETNKFCRQFASLQHLILSDSSNFALEFEVSLVPRISNNTTNEYNTSASPLPSSNSSQYVQNEHLTIPIERWKISCVPQGDEWNDGSRSGITTRSLHSAIRSYLHFSQLAAWLSKKKKFTSQWRVKIDIGESDGDSNLTERHEFPVVILEEAYHLHHQYSPSELRGTKGLNSRYVVKVMVDSLPRMENFPKPGLSLPSPTSTSSTEPSLPSTSSSLVISTPQSSVPSHIQHKSQQMMLYTNGVLMLEEKDENRIRFNGRSRRSHGSGGNNGSSSHRSRPKNLRIAKPETNLSFEDDADIGILSNRARQSGFPMSTSTSLSISSTVTSNGESTIVRGKDGHLLAAETNHFENNSKILTIGEKIFHSNLNHTKPFHLHNKNSLPLTTISSPVFGNSANRFGNSANRFDFHHNFLPKFTRGRAPGCPHFTGQRFSEPSHSLLLNFEESILNGRFKPASTVDGFTIELEVGNLSLKLPVSVSFYTFKDSTSSPYSAQVTLSPSVYSIPHRGTLQVTLYNPLKTIVKMFVINYDLSQMEPNSHTFIRQKILFMPLGKSEKDADSRKYLRYLIHLRFCSSPTGDKIYLHKDIRMIVLQKSDTDTAVGLSSVIGGGSKACGEGHRDKKADISTSYELRSFTYIADVPSSSSCY